MLSSLSIKQRKRKGLGHSFPPHFWCFLETHFPPEAGLFTIVCVKLLGSEGHTRPNFSFFFFFFFFFFFDFFILNYFYKTLCVVRFFLYFFSSLRPPVYGEAFALSTSLFFSSMKRVSCIKQSLRFSEMFCQYSFNPSLESG